MMSTREMRALQVILATMIVGMTWLIAIGEGAFIIASKAIQGLTVEGSDPLYSLSYLR